MIFSVNDVAQIGIITDLVPMQLAPNAWTDGLNVKFSDNKVKKAKGWESFFDPGSTWDGGSGQVYWAIPYHNEIDALWIYFGLKDARATNGATDVEITNAGGDFAATAERNWTGGILSSFLIVNNGIDPPQSWDGDFSTPSKLIDLANFSAAADSCGAMRVYKNYLVALDVVKSGIRYKSLVKWSNSAALKQLPDSWDSTDETTDAGETDLSEKLKDVNIGAVIDCMPLRDTNIVYTDSQTWAMDFVGGQFIFKFRQLFKNNGILTRRCVAEFEGKHFVVGNADVYVHSGVTLKSVIDAKRRRFLFANMDSNYYKRTFVFANYKEKEMWICYTATGSSSPLPNKALVWSWVSGAWGEKELHSTLTHGTPHISAGTVDTSIVTDRWSDNTDTWTSVDRQWELLSFNPQAQTPLIVADKLYKGESTNSENGTAMSSFIERTDIPVGEIDQIMRIKTIFPKMTGDAAVNIHVGSHLAPGQPVSYASPVQFTPGTDTKIDVRKTGTHMAVKFESTGDQEWELLGYEVEAESVGRRGT